MFGLIRKKKVKDAIEHIQNEYRDFTKDDPLFTCRDVRKSKSDQYHYYMGNLNCAEYIASRCGIGERKGGDAE